MANYKYLNRVRTVSSGAFVYWITNGSPDPTLTAANAPSPPANFADHVVVSKQPYIASAKLIKENLSNQANGSATSFTVGQNYEANTIRVYWNGQRQIQGDTFTETSSNTFQTTFTPASGGAISVEYYPL